MKKVKIADLKAHLSEHLRYVRQGHVLTVHDRSTPVARVVPYGSDAGMLEVRPPAGRYRTLQEVPLPRPLKLDVDSVEVLLEDRRGGR